MSVKSIWLRRIHKWVGLVIGIQFLLWAISGTAMALLDMDDVSGGEMAEHVAPPVPSSGPAWSRVQQAVGGQPVHNLSLRVIGQQQIFEIKTATGVRLFNATDGVPIIIDRDKATVIASAAHPSGAKVERVSALTEVGLAVRDHKLPIWQIDFRDEPNSSYYVSGTTGAILERRNDSWRWWDFFWMLHNMDYLERSSFNHPLIITVGFTMTWLAVTGFWLLFRTMWRHDFTTIGRALKRHSVMIRAPNRSSPLGDCPLSGAGGQDEGVQSTPAMISFQPVASIHELSHRDPDHSHTH